MRRDIGNEETEALLKRLENDIAKEYEQAVREVSEKLDDYTRRFAVKDEIKRKSVDAGLITKEEYIKWRQQQILVEIQHRDMIADMARTLHKANEEAISTAYDYLPDVFAENHNYATYLIETEAKLNTSYALYDKTTVRRLIRDTPKLLPDPRRGSKTDKRLRENKDLRWNRQKLFSAVTQGILQGESIPKIAKRLENVGEIDHRAAIRNARTMVTGAQNAGRMEAARRANDMGIQTVNVWVATLDMRTRHEHRELDGQRKDVDEPFVVPSSKEEIRFPGDPEASPHMVYNCRCTLIQQVKGKEYAIRVPGVYDDSKLDGMSYEEWKDSKVEKPNKITLPEEKAAMIRGGYIAEYRKLRKELDNSKK